VAWAQKAAGLLMAYLADLAVVQDLKMAVTETLVLEPQDKEITAAQHQLTGRLVVVVALVQ
jgi:hypothetical protein